MKYEDIKDFCQRCEEHEDHQSGMVSYGMISQRLQEEIDELREYIEQRTWVGLEAEDRLCAKYMQDAPEGIKAVIDYIEAKLKEKNTK